MKKLILFTIFLLMFLYARDNKYLNYTSYLLHYELKLKDFNKIKPPFEQKLILSSRENESSHSLLEHNIKVKLLSVFNHSAYIKIDKYIGNKLVKSYKKWVKVGDVFEKYYKVKKIKLNKIILKFKNKLIIKTLNKKIPGIKEK